MGFHEVRFPVEISYGSQGGPGFKTNVVVSDSGAEQRVARWTNARRSYDVRYGIRSIDDLVALQQFYIERTGVANGFRYKDWFDFTTSPGPLARRDTPADNDVEIGVGDGATTEFQLITKYGLKVRNITKPVDGTVVVAIDGTSQPSGWSVDTTTGIITFDTAPAIGELITAGCEFDVPVRFGTDVDEVLSMSYDGFEDGSSEIPLVEIADGMTTYDDFFFGGAYEALIDADIALSLARGRVYVLDTGSTDGLSAILPAVAGLQTGAPIFYVFNEGIDFDLFVKSSTGSTIITLGPGQCCELVLSIASDNATKVWYAL